MTDPAWVWVDLETTGLGADADLLEIAAVITTPDLVETSGLYQDIAYFDRDSNPGIDPVVLAMHDESGLWKECAEQGLHHRTRQVLDGFESWLVTEGVAEGFVLAGSGVAHFDGPWLDHHSPLVAARRTYYSIDVGGTRRLARGAGVSWPGAGGEKSHRATDDILDHLEEARWLQRMISIGDEEQFS